jgi:membrane protein DedA with SNARE-associated domain
VNDLIAQVTSFLEANPRWIIAVAGIAAFEESLVIVGIFVPGTTLLALIGGMAGAGLVDPVQVAVAGIVGALAGDTLTYWLGRLFGPRILRWKVLRRYRRGIAQARLFFRRYGIWAVVIGRFFGPLRATVPLVAGVIRMRVIPFQIANVASALLWAPLVMSPGFLAARGIGGVYGIDWSAWILIGIAATTTITVAGLFVSRWLLRRRRRPPKD